MLELIRNFYDYDCEFRGGGNWFVAISDAIIATFGQKTNRAHLRLKAFLEDKSENDEWVIIDE